MHALAPWAPRTGLANLRREMDRNDLFGTAPRALAETMADPATIAATTERSVTLTAPSAPLLPSESSSACGASGIAPCSTSARSRCQPAPWRRSSACGPPSSGA